MPLRTVQNHANSSQMLSEARVTGLTWYEALFSWQWDSTDTPLRNMIGPLQTQTYTHTLHIRTLCNWTHCHLCQTQALCCQRVKRKSRREKSKVGWEWKQCSRRLRTHAYTQHQFKVGTASCMTSPKKGTVTWLISIFDLPRHFVEIFTCVCVPLSDLDLPLSPALIEADTWEGPVYDSPQPVHIKSCSLKVCEHQHHLSTSRLDACSLHWQSPA